MKRDWRLSVPSSANEALSERQKEEDRLTREKHLPHEWQDIGERLASMAVTTLTNAVPSEFTETIDNAWQSHELKAVWSAIGSRDRDYLDTSFTRVVGRTFVPLLARSVAALPHLWLGAFSIASTFPEGWSLFLESMDRDELRKGQEVLFCLPLLDQSDDWIDRFDRLSQPGIWEGFIEDLRERQSRPIDDPWRLAVELENTTDRSQLAVRIRMLSDLARVAGADIWARWLTNLPFPWFAQLAISDLDDIDDIPSFLKSLLADDEVLHAVLVLRRTCDLFQAICDSLGNPRSGILLDDDANQAYRSRLLSELTNWKSKEMGERAEGIATAILQGGASGAHLATIALRNLFDRSVAPSRDEDSIAIAEVRHQILLACLKTSPSPIEWADRVIEAREPAILSIMELAGELKDSDASRAAIGSLAFEAYRNWLSSEEIWWPQPLGGDDLRFVQMVAFAITMRDDPLGDVDSLFRAHTPSFEGWKYDSRRSFRSVNHFGHVAIVSATASDFLVGCGRRAIGEAVFGRARSSVERWLRALPSLIPNTAIETCLAHIWARYFLIYGSEYVGPALEGIESLESLPWLLIAFENLAINLPKGTSHAVLDEKVQASIRERLSQEERGLRDFGMSADDADKLLQRARALTGKELLLS